MDVVIAIVASVALFVGALWVIRMLATPRPPEPDPSEIIDVEVAFRCSECGMQLMVTHAQDQTPAPPRHCREEMVPLL